MNKAVSVQDPWDLDTLRSKSGWAVCLGQGPTHDSSNKASGEYLYLQ